MEHIFTKLLQDFEQGKMSRRQLIQSLVLTATATSAAGAAPAPAPAPAGTVFKATRINHVSYEVADINKTRDFYVGLLGMTVEKQDPIANAHELGKNFELTVGDSSIVVRPARNGEVKDAKPPLVDHIGYTIAGWDTDKNVRPALEAELKRRGLYQPHVVINPNGAGAYNFHIKDPDGFHVQLGGEKQ